MVLSDRLFLVAAVCAALLLAFLAGSYVVLAQVFPARFLDDAYRAADALIAQRGITNRFTQTDLWRRARTDARGVTVHRPDAAFAGYTLYTSGDGTHAILVDMAGTEVHRWSLSYSALWQTNPDDRTAQSADLMYWRKARLLPDGSVIAVFLASLFEHVDLAVPSIDLHRAAAGLHLPDYYRPPFSASEQATIAAITAETAARLGYHRAAPLRPERPFSTLAGLPDTMRRSIPSETTAMRRVVFNQKGGVGKTTILCNLAAIAASHGKRTLVIDLDAQCNASQYLLSSVDTQAEAGTADFFENTLGRSRQSNDLSGYITPTPFDNLHLMAAHPDLEDIRVKLEAKHKIYKLRQALDSLDSYDAVYIDTPPAMNFFSQSALIAASHCLIPFDCDDFARQALYNLFDAIGEIQEDHNPGLVVDGIVVNQFQTQAKLPQRLIDELKAEGHPLLDEHITSSVKVRESHEASVPLVYFTPSHKVSRQYASLYDALAKRRKAR